MRSYPNATLIFIFAGYFITISIAKPGARFVPNISPTSLTIQRVAVDTEIGKPIPARGKVERTQSTLFTARTAKELCVKILEETRPSPVTMLDHAAYLGREFVRAEIALLSDREYVQD